MSIAKSNTSYEPSSQIAMVRRFLPIVDLTRNDEGTISHMSDIQLQLPASASVSSNTSAVVTLSEAEGDLMRNVPSLHPKPSQTGVNAWQFQYPNAYL